MKKAKKILTLVLSALLLMSLSVVGTLAYLTKTTNVVENTFTVGEVTFDTDGALDEAPVDLYGEVVEGERRDNNEYKLIPNHQYIKDPTVHMSADTEDAWLFVQVVNEIADIEVEAENVTAQYEGTENGKEVSGTIHGQMLELGWVLIDEVNNVYAYTEVVSKDQHIVVFEGFKLSGEANVAEYEDATITIQAYAVQADGFESDDTTPGYLKAWNGVGAQWPDPDAN